MNAMLEQCKSTCAMYTSFVAFLPPGWHHQLASSVHFALAVQAQDLCRSTCVKLCMLLHLCLPWHKLYFLNCRHREGMHALDGAILPCC